MKGKVWTEQEKTEIVLAVLKNEASKAELCRRYGVSEVGVANWVKTFLEGGKQALSRRKNQKNSEIFFLQKENEELKKAVGELSLENRVLKKTSKLF